MEISKIHRVCLVKNSEDRLLYLMTGPGLPAFCDHWLCVVHSGDYGGVTHPASEALLPFSAVYS